MLSKIFNNLFQKTNLTPDEALKKLEKEYQKATEIFPKISDYEYINNQQKAEIKLAFWFLRGGEALQIKYKETVFGKIVHENILRILFQEAMEDNGEGNYYGYGYGDRFYMKIYKQRQTFYYEYMNNKDQWKNMGYVKKATRFLTKRPFSEDNEDESIIDFIESFDFDKTVINEFKISSIFIKSLPNFSKNIQFLYLNTK